MQQNYHLEGEIKNVSDKQKTRRIKQLSNTKLILKEILEGLL